MSIKNFELSEIDHKILGIMQEDSSLANHEIAKKIGLSPSATHERIKKLYAVGVIKKTVALVQAAAVDRELCAFIQVLIDTSSHSKKFLEKIIKDPAVMECYHITGEYSYLLKVRVENTRALEAFITDVLKGQAGVVKTMTSIALSSSKEGDTLVG